MTRVGTAAFRGLKAADDVVDWAGRRVSNLHDRVDIARNGLPDWSSLFPDTRLVEAAYAPIIDRLDWDTLHVVDPGVVELARGAVARRRAAGAPAQQVAHLDPVASGGPHDARGEVPYAQAQAYAELVRTLDSPIGVPLPAHIEFAEGEAPVEKPWSRADLPATIGIGAYNQAGQAWAWAKSIERVAPGVRTQVVTIDRGSHLVYPSDLVIPMETFTDDISWMEQFEADVLDTWTHALIEGGRAILGRRYGRTFINDAAVLGDVGITVGLLFHGSDLRDPRLHASRTPWSPFHNADGETVQALQARRDVLVDRFLEFEGPAWVSTPDLLADLPTAQWLPVVVDVERWASEQIPMERPIPRVVHAPSRTWTKGTDQLEQALRALRDDGLIDYRRVEGVAPEQMPDVIGAADIILDQFALGSYGVAAVEAMAAGRVVVGHVMEEVRERCEDLPIVEATPESIDGVLRDLVRDRDRARAVASAGREYAARVHDGRRSGELLVARLRPVAEGHSHGRLRPRD
ncbi:MAG TPA: glycosyltransferase family 4 protein [Intrasporangiaceae bacterium]|nr:glycosyltransferase family 4 protein [Intrasporangiaceae bacterium]